jgi:cobalt/nickel transport protein
MTRVEESGVSRDLGQNLRGDRATEQEDVMKRRFDGFVWVGLGVALLVALFLSPFASTSPERLEKIAEAKRVSETGEGWKFWEHAPFSNYTLPWIKNAKVSTALSGFAGTLAIFFITIGIAKMIRKR